MIWGFSHYFWVDTQKNLGMSGPFPVVTVNFLHFFRFLGNLHGCHKKLGRNWTTQNIPIPFGCYVILLVYKILHQLVDGLSHSQWFIHSRWWSPNFVHQQYHLESIWLATPISLGLSCPKKTISHLNWEDAMGICFQTKLHAQKPTKKSIL